MKDNGNVVVVVIVETMKMWWWCWRKDNGNVVAVMDERHWKCGGGSGCGGIGKALEMCW